ncbi:MAG: 3-phenylpropionate/cinnamic acid dioxygenase small subunit [Hyphomicrobiaceae bacterium]|jgi:3-phenylpropionate/cinnamic acid dioxygenase small subunit
MSDSEEIKNLLDERSIERLLVRYCSIIDAKDFASLREVFTEDALIDYESAGGARGTREEIITWLGEALAPFVVVQHMVSNFDIRIDGNQAHSTCYFHNPMGMPAANDKTSVFWCGGRYRDVLSRTPKGWRITTRINETLYMHGA